MKCLFYENLTPKNDFVLKISTLHFYSSSNKNKFHEDVKE